MNTYLGRLAREFLTTSPHLHISFLRPSNPALFNEYPTLSTPALLLLDCQRPPIYLPYLGNSVEYLCGFRFARLLPQQMGRRTNMP